MVTLAEDLTIRIEELAVTVTNLTDALAAGNMQLAAQYIAQYHATLQYVLNRLVAGLGEVTAAAAAFKQLTDAEIFDAVYRELKRRW